MTDFNDKVKEIVQGREEKRGDMLQNLTNISNFWRIFILHLAEKAYSKSAERKQAIAHVYEVMEHLGPEEVAQMMILLKLGRQQEKSDTDNYLDIAGYAQCADTVHEMETKRYG